MQCEPEPAEPARVTRCPRCNGRPIKGTRTGWWRTCEDCRYRWDTTKIPPAEPEVTCGQFSAKGTPYDHGQCAEPAPAAEPVDGEALATEVSTRTGCDEGCREDQDKGKPCTCGGVASAEALAAQVRVLAEERDALLDALEARESGVRSWAKVLARAEKAEAEVERLRGLIPKVCCNGADPNCYGPRGCLVRAQEADATPADEMLARVERLREALELYACAGRPACTEPMLKDGTCVRDHGGGACGAHALAALRGEEAERE